jgi:hypothetical protein
MHFAQVPQMVALALIFSHFSTSWQGSCERQ